VNRGITLVNRQRKRRLDLLACQAFAEIAVERVQKKSPKVSLPEEIGVFFVSDIRMSQIHRDFLAVEGTTDVITFHHGEIFISVETAERHAQLFSTSFLQEIHLYIVHGLLHLAGFDDRTKGDSKQMAAAQEEIIREIEATLRDRNAEGANVRRKSHERFGL
jgi:probable rRNA maturation factor